MEEIPERGAEGGLNESIVFEYVGEDNVPEVLGEFSLATFLEEVEGEPEIPDDNPEVPLMDDDVLDDASASSACPSVNNNKEWENELKDPEFDFKTNEDFVESTRNPNTVRKTNQVVRAFQKWLKKYCYEERQIETIEPAELDGFLSNYLLNKKTSKGAEHEPDTLTSIHRAVLRHLKHNAYPVDPMFHDTFEMSRDVLSSKRTKLKQEGLGNRPNRAESFDEEEIDLMWQNGALGNANPTTLQHTMYWFLAIGFGLRGCQESRSMKWGDVQLLQDKDGLAYLEWNERVSKTRQGGEGGHVRSFAPKIYATHDERCPVAHYKQFAAKRPLRSLRDDAPFYLTVRQGSTMDDDSAYITGPMGVNKLRDVVKIICEKAGVTGRHTNHSLRKTTCQTLMANNVPPVLVAQLSGHKCLSSLNNYSTATKPQQRAMSHILTGKRNMEPTSLSSHLPAKRNPSESLGINPTSSHGNMILPPAPVAMSLPRPHPYYLPVPTEPNTPEQAFQRMAENASGMFSGAYVNGSISMHFNYNVQANTHSQVNMSPKLPSVDKSDM